MKEKEWNLSDKNKFLVDGIPTKDNYYQEKDVKEFIKKFNEGKACELCKHNLNKLAGDKLVK